MHTPSECYIMFIKSSTLFQEGFRYNALHVACWKNRPACCRLLLETLEDEAFMAKLYPQDSEAVRQERIKHICDLYLNMPDKGVRCSALRKKTTKFLTSCVLNIN